MRRLWRWVRSVLVGRPYVYGLVPNGEEGVAHELGALCGDLTMTLHLSGVTRLQEQD